MKVEKNSNRDVTGKYALERKNSGKKIINEGGVKRGGANPGNPGKRPPAPPPIKK